MNKRKSFSKFGMINYSFDKLYLTILCYQNFGMGSKNCKNWNEKLHTHLKKNTINYVWNECVNWFDGVCIRIVKKYTWIVK